MRQSSFCLGRRLLNFVSGTVSPDFLVGSAKYSFPESSHSAAHVFLCPTNRQDPTWGARLLKAQVVRSARAFSSGTGIRRKSCGKCGGSAGASRAREVHEPLLRA